MISNLKSLVSNESFLRIFKNGSWLFTEKVIRMALGVSVGVWVARYLGPEQFGKLNYAQSFVGLFAVIASLGLDGIVVKELVNNQTSQDELLSTVFWMKIIGAIASFLFICMAIEFSNSDELTRLLILIISVGTLFQSFNVVEMYFQSHLMGKYAALSNICALILSNLIKLTLILWGAELIYFALSFAFDSLVLALSYIFFYNKKQSLGERSPLLSRKFNNKLALSLLSDSWPLILSSAASMINMRVDQVLLGASANFYALGNYAAAVRISEMWFILPAIIGSSIYPYIIKAKQNGVEIYRARIIKVIKYMSIFAITFAITVSIFSNVIISLLYGDKYQEAATYLSIHIWSGVPYLALFVYSQVSIIENLNKYTFYISALSVILNLSLNYILIPIYGGLGAVIVTLIVAWISVLSTLLITESKANILKIWSK